MEHWRPGYLSANGPLTKNVGSGATANYNSPLVALVLENEVPLWLFGSKSDEPQPNCGSYTKSDKKWPKVFFKLSI